LGLDVDKKVIDCITNLGIQQLETLSNDLEAFAKHGKRTIVNTDDVKLLARRNPKLTTHLTSIEQTIPKPKLNAIKQQSSLRDFAENSLRKRKSTSISPNASENPNSYEVNLVKKLKHTTTKK